MKMETQSVPIGICIFSTILELRTPKIEVLEIRMLGWVDYASHAVCPNGYFLLFQLTVHGCSLHEKSRWNFTVKCMGCLLWL